MKPRPAKKQGPAPVFGQVTLGGKSGWTVLPITGQVLKILRQATIGKKRIDTQEKVTEGRFGSLASRQKERDPWQLFINSKYRELLKVQPGKRPSLARLARIASLHFNVPVWKISRYTRHPDREKE